MSNQIKPAETANNSTQLTTISDVINEQVVQVLETNFNNFQSAFVMSTAIQKIDEVLTTEIMKPILALQGKKIGFKTDKIYGLQVVKDCVIEALLNGLQVTGNQFNIIANNMYVTKEGFGHLLKKIKTLRYQIQHTILGEEKGYVKVSSKITWGDPYNNEAQKQIQIFLVRAGNYATPDSIIGKAERKARKWLYEYLTGKELAEGETIDIPHSELEIGLEESRNANKKEISFDDAKKPTKEKESAKTMLNFDEKTTDEPGF